ncbi:MAG: biotin/lipoyl-containing protein, partial [Rhodospirillales bacterium]|nr:biotin/lipoyl-containing protein [Rhodospirillales bacterium]
GFLPAIGRLIRYREPVTGVFGTHKNVRVDGGVNEGDEITRFYDPMVSKLITHGATRDEAIKHMRWALDEYYVRGIGNNIGFLAAVMMHPRFCSGELTTNFIAEEFGEHFVPEETIHEDFGMLAALAGAIHCRVLERDIQLTGRSMDNTVLPRGEFELDRDWVVVINGESHPVSVSPVNGEIEVRADGRNFVITTDWSTSQELLKGTVNGEDVCLQVDRNGGGYQLWHLGLRADVRILSPEAAELLSRMPPKKKADMTKKLLSPMPGLLVSVEVVEGQEVKADEALAVVEAMKMENQLLAERDGIVSVIHLDPGDSLDAGQVILEFE